MGGMHAACRGRASQLPALGPILLWLSLPGDLAFFSSCSCASFSPDCLSLCLCSFLAFHTGSCFSSLCSLQPGQKGEGQTWKAPRRATFATPWQELWSLGVDGHRGGALVQPPPQPLREPLHSPLRPCLPHLCSEPPGMSCLLRISSADP